MYATSERCCCCCCCCVCVVCVCVCMYVCMRAVCCVLCEQCSELLWDYGGQHSHRLPGPPNKPTPTYRSCAIRGSFARPSERTSENE